MNNRIFITTDVGGTFTDAVSFCYSSDGNRKQFNVEKSDTTPPNYEQGVLDVLKKLKVSISDISMMVHGSTVVINTLTEKKGAVTALITTSGFKDVLEIGRGNRPDFFNLSYKKPESYIPRYLRFEVDERITHTGEIEKNLSLKNIPSFLKLMKDEKVQSIAICLLNSYINPEHEILIAKMIKSIDPDFNIVCSHEITREWREYERTSTTALAAYVKPIVSNYLENLNEHIKNKGFSGDLYVMQSNCGIDTLKTAKKIPITMVESGPSSGFLGAAVLGEYIGEKNIIALDIGGTTAKCTLIHEGKIQVNSDYYIERDQYHAGHPIMVPVVDLVEIGNGGGSIAWVDEFFKLHVGPQSAGAFPGPVAYNKGGTNITVTDANLFLGRINKDYFCGGEIQADMLSVSNGLRALSKQLDMTESDIARGIIRIANNNMINALKLISINKGYDPRDFTMIAFGGGGPLHACALAAELGIKKVIIPAVAPVFSAWGMMMSGLRRDRMLTYLCPFEKGKVVSIYNKVENLKKELEISFLHEGFLTEMIEYQVLGRFRYKKQEHSIEVEFIEPLIDDNVDIIIERFQTLYEKEYTYRLNNDIELVGIHVISKVILEKIPLQKYSSTGKSLDMVKKGVRPVDYISEGIISSIIYDGDQFEPNMSFSGPAIIEQKGTTTVIHPDQNVFIDDYLNIIVTLN